MHALLRLMNGLLIIPCGIKTVHTRMLIMTIRTLLESQLDCVDNDYHDKIRVV